VINIKIKLVPKWNDPTQKNPISICIIKHFSYKLSSYKYKTVLLCFVHKKYGFDEGFAIIETEIQENHPKHTDYMNDTIYLFEKYKTAHKYFEEMKKKINK